MTHFYGIFKDWKCRSNYSVLYNCSVHCAVTKLAVDITVVIIIIALISNVNYNKPTTIRSSHWGSIYK